MERAIISVVIPTYNSSSYIVRTLDSVLKQTVLPDEIVIVDDGSFDNTIERINEYIDEHKKIFGNIHVFQQKNLGAGAARNRAITESNGTWIAFLDSDDIWLPDKIKAVKDAMKSNPEANIIAHDEYAADEKNLESKRICSLHEEYDSSQDLFLQLYKGNLFSTSCMVIKKEIIEKAGGFDESLKSAQDYDLWIRCGLYGNLFYIPKPYEIYVTREGNITSNTYRRYLCEMIICNKYINEIEKRIGKKEAKKIVIRRIYHIHKIESYLSLRQKRLGVMLKIILRLIPELFREIYT